MRCYQCSIFIQLKVASILTGGYSLLMMIVLIGMMIDITNEGWCSPNAIFFYLVAGVFIIGAILHPQEFWNLPFGIIYFIFIPSVYLLLMIYMVANLNDMSWGTREGKVAKDVDKTKVFSCGVDKVFRFILCPKTTEKDIMLSE